MFRYLRVEVLAFQLSIASCLRDVSAGCAFKPLNILSRMPAGSPPALPGQRPCAARRGHLACQPIRAGDGRRAARNHDHIPGAHRPRPKPWLVFARPAVLLRRLQAQPLHRRNRHGHCGLGEGEFT